MTRRERLERKVEKRRDWAAGAQAESSRRFDAARKATDGIPFGQPVLVGHHSEKHHRRALEKADSNMSKGCEASDRAKNHIGKAAGLEQQLETCVFSDDHDAIEQLEARIKERELEADRDGAINKAWRKGKGQPGWEQHLAFPLSEKLAASIAKTMALCPWLKSPVSTTGTRAAIRRDKERIEYIRKMQQRQTAAEAAGGMLLSRSASDWCSVRFAEKPEYRIITDLKSADFHWSNGAWHGKTDKIPASVLSIEQEQNDQLRAKPEEQA